MRYEYERVILIDFFFFEKYAFVKGSIRCACRAVKRNFNCTCMCSQRDSSFKYLKFYMIVLHSLLLSYENGGGLINVFEILSYWNGWFKINMG